MEEHIDQQVSKLKINLEQAVNRNVNTSQESIEIDTDCLHLKLSPNHLLSTSFMSEGRYLNDNQWLEEIENLAYSYDTALMALEDYRSHEHRRESSSAPIQITCQLDEIPDLQQKLEQKSSFNIELGGVQVIFTIGARPVKEEVVPAVPEGKKKGLKKTLEHYNDCIKKKKIQLFKDIEEIENRKKNLIDQKLAFEDQKEDFDSKVNVIKKTLKQFSDHLNLFQVKSSNETDTKTEIEESPESVQQMIANIQNLLLTASGKLKENLQMQLNRLKTRLATLRSEAVLISCQSGKSYSGRRSMSRTSIKNPMRFSTPIRSNKPNSNVNASFECNKSDHEVIMREVNIIKARLLEKQDELRDRELKCNDFATRQYKGSLYKQEEGLFRQQEDLDRQKIVFAERVGKFNAIEQEFYQKQDEINEYVKMIRNQVQEFLSFIG